MDHSFSVDFLKAKGVLIFCFTVFPQKEGGLPLLFLAALQRNGTSLEGNGCALLLGKLQPLTRTPTPATIPAPEVGHQTLRSLILVDNQLQRTES